MLSVNYRTKEEILKFISSAFYGGPEHLVCRSQLPDISDICPMYFYATEGCEVLDEGSTSYYNLAEVEEVANRVLEMYEKWPLEWGQKEPQRIAVVASSYAQVCIFSCLINLLSY